jgi:hypothetical protein
VGTVSRGERCRPARTGTMSRSAYWRCRAVPARARAGGPGAQPGDLQGHGVAMSRPRSRPRASSAGGAVQQQHGRPGAGLGDVEADPACPDKAVRHPVQRRERRWAGGGGGGGRLGHGGSLSVWRPASTLGEARPGGLVPHSSEPRAPRSSAAGTWWRRSFGHSCRRAHDGGRVPAGSLLPHPGQLCHGRPHDPGLTGVGRGPC